MQELVNKQLNRIAEILKEERMSEIKLAEDIESEWAEESDLDSERVRENEYLGVDFDEHKELVALGKIKCCDCNYCKDNT